MVITKPLETALQLSLPSTRLLRICLDLAPSRPLASHRKGNSSRRANSPLRFHFEARQRTPAFQAGCRGFESRLPLQVN